MCIRNRPTDRPTDRERERERKKATLIERQTNSKNNNEIEVEKNKENRLPVDDDDDDDDGETECAWCSLLLNLNLWLDFFRFSMALCECALCALSSSYIVALSSSSRCTHFTTIARNQLRFDSSLCRITSDFHWILSIFVERHRSLFFFPRLQMQMNSLELQKRLSSIFLLL